MGETQLLASHVEAAHAHATGALALAHKRQERGHQADALRLLGDIAVRRDPSDIDQAVTHYRQALALAEDLGMRPLGAHCHRSLGEIYVSWDSATTPALSCPLRSRCTAPWRCTSGCRRRKQRWRRPRPNASIWRQGMLLSRHSLRRWIPAR